MSLGGYCIAVYLSRGPGYYGDADKELYVVPELIDAHEALNSLPLAVNE